MSSKPLLALLLAAALTSNGMIAAPARGRQRQEHIYTGFILTSSLFVVVSSQGWSDGLFLDPVPLTGAMTQPCPKGATRPPGHQHGKCQCAFGHNGEIKWSDSRNSYVGTCSVTPCPQHARHGKFPGSCYCDAPFKGNLQWRSQPEPHYLGKCVRVSCPPSSRLISSVEEVDVELLHGDDLMIEETDAHGIFVSTAALLGAKAKGRQPRVTMEKEPRCGCAHGYAGGYMWNFPLQQWKGGCLQVHPCVAGQRGAHPAEWVAGPWKFQRGWQSPKVLPQLRGACEPAPCPPHAHFNVSLGLCLCTFPYRGNLHWKMEDEAYEGHCTNTWGCPSHAEQRFVPISATQKRLGCVCSDGYHGGGTRWSLHKWEWHGNCSRVPCPSNTQFGKTGLCSCPEGQEGLRWSRKHHMYLGHCRARVVSTSSARVNEIAISATTTKTVLAPNGTSGGRRTTTTTAVRKTMHEHVVRPASGTTITTTRHLAPDQLNIEVGYAMYVVAAFVACAGIVIGVQSGASEARSVHPVEGDLDEDLSSFDWGYDKLIVAPDVESGSGTSAPSTQPVDTTSVRSSATGEVPKNGESVQGRDHSQSSASSESHYTDLGGSDFSNG